MDVQSVLIGALLMDDQLAPYSLPELNIEHFRPELQPTFAAVHHEGILYRRQRQVCAAYRFQEHKRPFGNHDPPPVVFMHP